LRVKNCGLSAKEVRYVALEVHVHVCKCPLRRRGVIGRAETYQ
jgi:hypothetical protein